MGLSIFMRAFTVFSPSVMICHTCSLVISLVRSKNTLPNRWVHLLVGFKNTYVVCSPNSPSETEKLLTTHWTQSSVASAEPLSCHVLHTPLDSLRVHFWPCSVHFIPSPPCMLVPNTRSCHTNKYSIEGWEESIHKLRLLLTLAQEIPPDLFLPPFLILQFYKVIHQFSLTASTAGFASWLTLLFYNLDEERQSHSETDVGHWVW